MGELKWVMGLYKDMLFSEAYELMDGLTRLMMIAKEKGYNDITGDIHKLIIRTDDVLSLTYNKNSDVLSLM